MLTRFVFTRLSQLQQANLIRKWGIMLGTRRRGGREVYTYMLFYKLFAEILYVDDDANEPVEEFTLLPGWKSLNEHFEREVRAAAAQ